jgi:hypothetical protein
MEDTTIQKRCEGYGLSIDRSVFYEIGSPEILQLFDGISRIISKKDPWRGDNDDGINGIRTIHQLKCSINEKSENPNDNIFTVHNSRIFFINISTFLTQIPFGSEEYYNYDLREPKRKIIHPDRIRETRKTIVSTNDWSNIPYYPTDRERRENVAKYLMSMGKQVPDTLIRQIEEDKHKEVQEDHFNNFSNSSVEQNSQPQNQFQGYQQPQQNVHVNPFRQQPQQQQVPHKFSPQYAAYVGAKPRAQSSARIGLGGVF